MFWRDSVKMYKLNQRIKSMRYSIGLKFNRNFHWIAIIGAIGIFSYSIYSANTWVDYALTEPGWYNKPLPAMFDTLSSAFLGLFFLAAGISAWRKFWPGFILSPLAVLGFGWTIQYASDHHIKEYAPRLLRDIELMNVILLCVLPVFTLVLIVSDRANKRRGRPNIWAQFLSTTNATQPDPKMEEPWVLRTDFTDQSAWETVCAIIRKPVDVFCAHVNFIDDETYKNLPKDQLLAQISKNYKYNFIIIVDSIAISLSDHPLLVMDLHEGTGNEFRAIPSQIGAIADNLSIANTDFEEFAMELDQDGVFRGYSR
jgi:hypothetical protein